MAAAYYSRIDFPAALAFDAPMKEGKLYVANAAPPLVISTPPVTLSTPLSSTIQHALVTVTGAFAGFLRDVETRVLETCIENKDTWFNSPKDEELLRHDFKSFLVDDGTMKLRVSPTLAVYDASGNPVGPEEADVGQQVRCVWELPRICFGSREFGALWRLVQVRFVEVQPCLIADEESASEGGEPYDDVDEQEFQ